MKKEINREKEYSGLICQKTINNKKESIVQWERDLPLCLLECDWTTKHELPQKTTCNENAFVRFLKFPLAITVFSVMTQPRVIRSYTLRPSSSQSLRACLTLWVLLMRQDLITYQDQQPTDQRRHDKLQYTQFYFDEGSNFISPTFISIRLFRETICSQGLWSWSKIIWYYS